MLQKVEKVLGVCIELLLQFSSLMVAEQIPTYKHSRMYTGLLWEQPVRLGSLY